MSNALINTILRKSLIFTGAGFSKPAGCKLSNEMLKDLEERSFEESDNSIFTKSERKAIKFILLCLDYQARFRSLESNGKYVYKPNIEEFAQLCRKIKNRENLMPYPVSGNWSDKILTIEQEYNNENKNAETDIYTSIQIKILKHCYPEWLLYNKQNSKNCKYMEPFKELLKNFENNDTKLEIFTLNNDTILEDYFSDENAVYTGFVSNKWVGFEKDNINENPYNASRINLYKLHGSLNWSRLTDGSIIKSVNNEYNTNDENIEIEPLLIFGHGTKIYTIDPFFSLLEYFKRTLREKKIFLIIGYSFFDPHINNLIFNELSISQDKLMIIFNPSILSDNPNNIVEKDGLKILKGMKKSEFVDFVSNIQNSPIYSDLPDFNIKKISPDSFEYIYITTEQFISSINNIVKFISDIFNEKEKVTNIF